MNGTTELFYPGRAGHMRFWRLRETDRTGVTFVDAYTGSTGHGICRPAEKRWTEGSAPTPPGIAWHPNEQGMAAQAELILEALGHGP
jgi:hypothetical protein